MIIVKPTKRNCDAKLLCHISVKASPPVIGSKWNGQPQMFMDTPNGVFWQSMPTLTDNEIRVQSAILNKRQTAMRVDPRMALKEHQNEFVLIEPEDTRQAPLWGTDEFETGLIGTRN